MRRVHSHVMVEERPQPVVLRPGDRQDALPEQPVMDEEKVGAFGDRTVNRPLGGIDGGGDLCDGAAIRHLQPVHRTGGVRRAGDAEQPIEVRGDVGGLWHGALGGGPVTGRAGCGPTRIEGRPRVLAAGPKVYSTDRTSRTALWRGLPLVRLSVRRRGGG